MKTKNLRWVLSLLALAGVALLVSFSSAQATTLQVTLSPRTDAPYTQGGNVYQKVGSLNDLYPARWYGSADAVFTAYPNPSPSDPAKVLEWIQSDSVIGGIIPNAGDGLVLLTKEDSVPEGSLTRAWTFDSPVNWVTVHYDAKITAWYFANGITEFGVDFIQGNQGISNMRAYSSVPVPAAAYLFGSALIGLAGIGYRRKS